MIIRKILFLVLSVALLSLVACEKKSGSDQAKAPEPAAKPAVAAKPAEPPKPAEPVYSPEATTKLIGEMEKCEYDFSCNAYKPLVSFGAKAAPDLAKLACDPAKDGKARAVAAKALGEIKDADSALKLVEAAKKENDFMLRSELYKAAGASGSDPVFEALAKQYLSKEGKEQQLQTREGLVLYKTKAMDWALGELLKSKTQQVALADIVSDTASKDTLPAIQDALKKVKDPMAAHRLASKAIAFGDSAQFAVLIKGLKSKDQYDRSDAANFLAPVAKSLPEAQKAEVVKLLQAAKKKDQGGLTSVGYDDALKVLEGK